MELLKICQSDLNYFASDSLVMLDSYLQFFCNAYLGRNIKW